MVNLQIQTSNDLFSLVQHKLEIAAVYRLLDTGDTHSCRKTFEKEAICISLELMWCIAYLRQPKQL